MATPGKIEANFDALLKSYPTYNKLPKHLQNYIDELNKNLTPDEPKNTPCCLQISEALNGCGGEHKVPERSFRRRNPELPPKSGNYFLQAVDELEKYLAGKYGTGEEIKTTARNDPAKMKSYLNSKQGILLFRDGGAGAHTELWDKTTIIQSAGAPSSNGAVMNQEYIWGRPRVVFWEAIGDLASRIGIVPNWLPGWWEVTDIFETYYYYFYRTGTVYATKERPGMPVCPLTTKENSGAFKIDTLRKISIQWAASDSRAESFTLVESVATPTLAGSHPDTPAAPFKARKMF